MRIILSGCQHNGKTTLAHAIAARWPKYEVIEPSYRKLIVDKNLSINRIGDKESQEIIRNALCDDAINNASKTHYVSYRGIIDNVVHTLYLGEKDLIKDTDFIADSINICRNIVKMYDVIFWLPINEDIQLIDHTNPHRDMDKDFRWEINNIFEGVYDTYKENSGLFFDKEDQPPMIPLLGNTVESKLEEISQYFNDDGDLIEEKTSVLSELSEIYDQAQLLEEVKTGQPKLF